MWIKHDCGGGGRSGTRRRGTTDLLQKSYRCLLDVRKQEFVDGDVNRNVTTSRLQVKLRRSCISARRLPYAGDRRGLVPHDSAKKK